MPPSSGQATATRDAHNLAFDAAYVRPCTQEFVPKGVDLLNPAGEEAPPPGGLFSWNVTLPWLINFAYDLRSSKTRREAQEVLPKWAQDDWFTIEARAERNPSRNEIRQMVRSLLADRFQFAAHMETREGQVFGLVVAKPGLGLKPHPEGAPCTLSSFQPVEKKYPNVVPPYKAVPAHCGMFSRELSQSHEHRLEMLNLTMQQIADPLGMGLPLSVIDRTGLAGRYDALLDFGPDDIPPNTASSDAIDLPSMTVALEKQLGLKQAKQKLQSIRL